MKNPDIPKQIPRNVYPSRAPIPAPEEMPAGPMVTKVTDRRVMAMLDRWAKKHSPLDPPDAHPLGRKDGAP